MYKSSTTQGAAAGQGPTPGSDGAGADSEKKKDDVVDAEFVDVDEKKK